ncbi:related to SAF1 - protein involved in proteasome-dependent degradation [Ustilago trichophora]|uniref:Related to SAF1 - protein involved in proteasome-dependent degradation n=1 Tax=Ustilago trichophora TaxID=86804 RepID=A0A5C3EID5_9BASI|nr:related to SAF1 - protein involved in proteasome-dependent degradation [Ustilago trichophora]
MPTNPLELPLPVVVDNLLPLLSNRDLATLRLVSRQAKTLVEDEVLWKRKVISDFTFPSHATARVGGWFNLYRGLSNPHVYVWGSTNNGRLGTVIDSYQERERLGISSINGGIPYPLELSITDSSSTQSTSQGRRLGDSSRVKQDTGAVVEMLAGGWSFHARTSTGRVFYWGTMNGETWGGAQSSAREPGKPFPTPQLMNDVPRIQSLSGGRCHAVALTQDHEILEWRAWGTIWKLEGLPSSITDPPPPPPSFDHLHGQLHTPAKSNIKQLEAGWSFSTVLTHTGEVWLWFSDWLAEAFESRYYGRDERAAMMHAEPPGHENQKVFLLTVTPLRLPPIIFEEGDLEQEQEQQQQQQSPSKIIQISAGEDFIIALTESGTIHRIDLHLSNPTGDAAGRFMRQAQELMGETARDQWRRNLGSVLHRLMMTDFLQTSAHWQHLSAFETPQSLPNFENAWLNDGKVGKITHISAHFRRFVSFLSIVPNESTSEEDEETSQQTLVLLGSPASSQPELIPELQAKGVIKVTMGDYHFGALTDKGEILTWGSFSNGALGNWIPPWTASHSNTSLASSSTLNGSNRATGIAVDSDAAAGEGEGGGGDEAERGWITNLIPLPRMFTRNVRPTPRIGFAGRGGRAAVGSDRNSNLQTQSTQDVLLPTRIHICPQPQQTEEEREEEGKIRFAFDIAFAGWHSSALVMV